MLKIRLGGQRGKRETCLEDKKRVASQGKSSRVSHGSQTGAGGFANASEDDSDSGLKHECSSAGIYVSRPDASSWQLKPQTPKAQHATSWLLKSEDRVRAHCKGKGCHEEEHLWTDGKGGHPRENH